MHADLESHENALRAQRRRGTLETFEQGTEVPLFVLALAYIPLLVLPLLFELPATVGTAFFAIDVYVSVVFACEFIVRFVLSTERWRFIRRNWADLLIILLPFLRPLRIMRSTRALRVLFFVEPRGPITFAPRDLEVTVGADVAFATCLIHCDGTSAGPLELRLTTGLQKVDREWVITHEHHSVPTVEERFLDPTTGRE